MLNILWGVMMLIGIIWGDFHGRMAEVTEGALTGAKDAVSLCITMLGVMSVWTGLLEIAKKSGLIQSMTKGLAPFVNYMFPEIPKGHPVKEDISTNIIANILGLGWAATPAGLQAMKGLEELNPHPGTATKSMCTFLIINISSLQLIPINMIAYRSQYGSVNPAAVVGPALVATLITTLVGIIFARIMSRKEL